MSAEPKSSPKTQIIVALIGVFGVITAALITSGQLDFLKGKGKPLPPDPLPLQVKDVHVANGKSYIIRSGLKDGSKFYMDRGYVYDRVPAKLQGASFVMTACDDKFKTDQQFLSFVVNKPTSVYVTHSRKYQLKPDWLANDFMRTGMTLEVVGHSAGGDLLDVYQRDFPAGAVVLGGNFNPDAKGNYSMYSVILLDHP